MDTLATTLASLLAKRLEDLEFEMDDKLNRATGGMIDEFRDLRYEIGELRERLQNLYNHV